MAIPKRSSPSTSTQDLKHRVITCLNKLSDRDTQTIATTELEQIVKSLSDDSFSSFLTCLYDTDSSEKTPVRKQCVRLLGLLSSTHGEALSPYLSKMISNIIKRLHDSDSVVRSACIDSVTIMSTQINTASFLLFLKPLMETMVLEQDVNSQMGSALCLSSVIEASDDPELGQLGRVLPKLVKLLKSESFKAKPALLLLIRSVIGVGGVMNRNVLVNLISCLVEFLSCDDWASRKGAAEAFLKLAVLQKDVLSEFKSSCLSSFETRRFDKVKVVRDTMNQMIEAWKNVPGVSDSPPLLSRSSSTDKTGECSPSSSVSSSAMNDDFTQTKRKTMQRNNFPASKDFSATSVKKRSPLKSRNRISPPAIVHKADHKKSSFPVACKDNSEERNNKVEETKRNTKVRQTEVNESYTSSDSERQENFEGLQSVPRVLSYDEECSDSTISNNSEEQCEMPKESEDFSLLRKQLVQIENQQSSLLDLLQRFIGSSQNGIKSLESRVNGLEMALDEIMYDLRISPKDSSENTCCKLPGADFLSPKFWRKSEGRYSPSLRDMVYNDVSSEASMLDNKWFCHPSGGGGYDANPLETDIQNDMRINSDKYSYRMPNPTYRNAVRGQIRHHNGN